MYVWKRRITSNEVLDFHDGLRLRDIGQPDHKATIAYDPDSICIIVDQLPVAFLKQGSIYGEGVLCQEDNMSFDFYV